MFVRKLLKDLKKGTEMIRFAFLKDHSALRRVD